MIDPLHTAVAGVFDYPAIPHQRRHGPRGYLDYTSYKPWLRDEFIFRCVYCLTRERWQPDGHEAFSADPFDAQSTQPARRGAYENLFYVCCSCNAARGALQLPFNPSGEAIGAHLQVTQDGAVEPLTAIGVQFIAICHLNRPRLADFRRRLLRLLETLSASESPQATAALKELLAFPVDLPELDSKRPPEGNERPAGLLESCYARRQRGELPEFY
jgi:hypothetical protein